MPYHTTPAHHFVPLRKAAKRPTRLLALALALAWAWPCWPGWALTAWLVGLTGSKLFYGGVVSGKISYKHTQGGGGHQGAGHATERIPRSPHAEHGRWAATRQESHILA